MNKMIEQKKLEIEKLKKEVADLALADLEQAKKDEKPFEEIFELWLSDDVPKKDVGWLIHITVDGAGDIWEYIDYGEPNRRMTYTIQDIVRDLEHCSCYPTDHPQLSKEQFLEFKKKLMEENVGSTIFDW